MARQVLGGVVAEEILAEDREGAVVVVRSGVRRGIHEAAGEGLERKLGREGEAGVEGGDFGGAGGCAVGGGV